MASTDSPTKKCTYKSCVKPLRAKGYCSTHYATYRRGTLDSELSLGERISQGRRRAERLKTNARISKALTGRKRTPEQIERMLAGRTNSYRGEKHWNWKGGIHKKDKAERNRFVKTYVAKVLVRDNYTCQICDDSGVALHVDHIRDWADYPELRFELSNCRAVCRPCHYYLTFKRKMPRGSRWGLNTAEAR